MKSAENKTFPKEEEKTDRENPLNKVHVTCMFLSLFKQQLFFKRWDDIPNLRCVYG